MTGRLILILLLVICGIAGEARAQSATQTPSSLTEQLFERVNGSVCTIIAIDEEDNLVRRGSGFILRDSRLLVTNAHVLRDSGRSPCAERNTNTVVFNRAAI